MEWRVTAWATASALVFAFLGARVVTLVKPDFLRPFVFALLIAVAIYVFLVKDLGLVHQPKHARRKAGALGVLTGVVLGFYDGFFGPGTGSFLIFIFVGIFGFDFLTASASSKTVNLATNLGSLIYFGSTYHIDYSVGLPMAACNVLGSFVGTRMAILKGSRFVRLLFLVVVGALILRLAQQIF